MAKLQEIPGPAYMVDTGGLGLPQYCAAFLLPHPDEDELAIVETGPSVNADTIFDAIHTIGYDPRDVTQILPTHIHLDHAGATWRLLDACPNAQAIIHEKGAPYLTDPEKVDKLLASVERAVGTERFHEYGTFEPLREHDIETVTGGETIHIAGREMELIDAPGHAPHQYNVHDIEHNLVYTGDAAGIKTPNGPLLMTTPPPAFDLEAWHGTLDRLDALEAETLALTHFGTVDASEHLPAFREGLETWTARIQKQHEEGTTFEETVKRLMDAYDEARAIYDEETFRFETRMNAQGVWLWLDRN